MFYFRKLLFPFSFLYWLVNYCRNFMYDKHILKSHSFNVPVIAVGNLSTGGTGKTPQIEYLIRLLSSKYKVAVLSRGYKRKSKGFLLAIETSTAETLGDEPFQFFKKFKNIKVAVDVDRKNGIQKLVVLADKPQIILLDDAFQHRKVQAGLYVLLTTFNDLYVDDFVLPVGNLRESSIGAKRADVIVVTKCTEDLSIANQLEIARKLKIHSKQKLFFSAIEYDDFVYNESHKLLVTQIKTDPKIIVAGIANPNPFIDFLKNSDDDIMLFPDHHHFTENEIQNLKQKSIGKIIVTTEKDFVRLQDSVLKDNLFYLPIKSKILNDARDFDVIFTNFVFDFLTKS